MSSAVLQRSRRTTAGKRLASLIGKAAEDDDAFWSHKIWSEGGGGFSAGKKDDDTEEGSGSDSSDESDGEGSYHASDEDPDAAVDQFDSDFNESESSSDEEDAEAELLAQERKDKRAAHVAATAAGRKLPRPVGKGRGAVKAKRVLGEGWNAGLVLNWFPAGDGSGAISSSAPTSSAPLASSVPADAAPQLPLKASVSTAQSSAASSQPASSTTAPAAPISSQISQLDTKLPSAPIIPTQQSVQTQSISTQPVIPPKPITSRAASPTRKRNLRAGTLSKTIAAVQQSAISQKVTQQRSIAAKETSKQGKRHFTQEEMILEAIKETEVENNKWLLGRKRRKEMVQEEVKQNASAGNGNVVERFYSRRGGCNVISFMDMERLPDILTRPRNPTILPKGGSPKRKRSNSEGSKNSDSSPSRVTTKCVITGKEARYRDPKTMLGYYDLEAFRELRRRADAGLLPTAGAKKTTRGKKRQSFPKDRTMMASTSTKASLKVMVTQNGTPVSPPEAVPAVARSNMAVKGEASIVDVNFPTKRPPILPEGVQSSKVVVLQQTESKLAATTNQIATKHETAAPAAATASSSSSKNNSSTFNPSRKSPRKPKPSAKVLAETAASNHMACTATKVVTSNNVQPKAATAVVTTMHTNMNDGVSNASKGIPDKNNKEVPSLSEDPPLTKSSAMVKTQITIPPRKPEEKSTADPTNSNGARTTLEKTKEPGPKNGSTETSNLPNGKEIVA